jgi:hypothetical protein
MPSAKTTVIRECEMRVSWHDYNPNPITLDRSNAVLPINGYFERTMKAIWNGKVDRRAAIVASGENQHSTKQK